MGALIEINTDGLAKFAETISFALGGTARGEKKMADAKAYAAELEAKTKNKVALIEAQGKDDLANYVAAKETRKMKNTMAVIEKAQTHFTEGEKVSDEPIDEGWKNRFFGIVEEISDEELREIWGCVLAGEVKKPKSYSLRTLEVLRNLTKDEASLIAKIVPNVLKEEYVYRNDVLTVSESLILQDCGIMLGDGHGIQIQFEVEPNNKYAFVLDKEYALTLYNNSSELKKCGVRIYKLTTAGKEIVRLIYVNQNARDLFIKSFVNYLYSKGFSKISKRRIININDENVDCSDEEEVYNKE